MKQLIFHFFEMIDEVEKSMKINDDKIDQNAENDEKSVFSKLRDEDLIRNFADMKINQSSEQSNQSTFTFQSTALNRFSKNIFKLNYVKLNDSDYKSRDRDDRKKKCNQKNNRVFSVNQ